jgi:hypothetical protein
MKLNKLLQNFRDVSGAQLRNAEDFEEMLEELVLKARAKDGENITPCSGNKDFSTCVTAHNNDLMLWYNGKDHSTKTVSTKVI